MSNAGPAAANEQPLDLSILALDLRPNVSIQPIIEEYAAPGHQ